ncbi:GTPase [Alphaproteobacteria bacterium endosymbiont of Tiliacea citrago]|uniref:GTPase n=1 Tax=Alphaproteobacteria bacterium endosymbiont of Tiliacea citrago TaxID=3077944 RepID=UPI00313D9699
MFKNSFNIFLVGRPNVGKSSIFNFLLSKNEAITRDEDGTTLDWRSHKIGNITLWDTPGVFKFENLPAKVDYIYFVVENVLLDYDKKLYLELKSKFENILVIVNKIDKGEDFDYSFFDQHIKISLRSRFNIYKLKDMFMDHYKETPSLEKKIWAVMGKPNVGKSSLINSLLKFDLHKVKDEDGTTKEFLPVDIDDNVLLDTPGQRHNAFFPRYNNVFGIMVITNLENEKQDFRMINLAIKRNKPVFLVINKIDLINNNKKLAEIKNKYERIFNIPILCISCLTKVNLHSIRNLMKSMESSFYKRISTSTLNTWLVSYIKPLEPKIKFISQIETAYPKFFINSEIARDKEIMLKKKLSNHFGFCGIPMKIIFK